MAWQQLPASVSHIVSHIPRYSDPLLEPGLLVRTVVVAVQLEPVSATTGLLPS